MEFVIESDSNQEGEEKTEPPIRRSSRLRATSKLSNVIPTESTIEQPIEKSCNPRNMTYYCRSCDVLYPNAWEFKTHKPKKPSKSCRLKCKSCRQTFSQPSDYLVHFKERVDKKFKFKIITEKLCKQFDTISIAELPRITNNETIDSTELPKGEEISNSRLLIENNSAKSWYSECKLCSEKFLRPSDYLEHEIKHGDKPIAEEIITEKELVDVTRVEELPKKRNNQKKDSTELGKGEEIDGYGLTGMDLLTYLCSKNLLAPFVICTICLRRLNSKTSVLKHIKIHNFFSCCCPVCQWQVSTFESMQRI